MPFTKNHNLMITIFSNVNKLLARCSRNLNYDLLAYNGTDGVSPRG